MCLRSPKRKPKPVEPYQGDNQGGADISVRCVHPSERGGTILFLFIVRSDFSPFFYFDHVHTGLDLMNEYMLGECEL